MPCPLCGAFPGRLVRSEREVESESRLRSDLVRSRLGYTPIDLERMDLTLFMHDGPAEILECANCGIVWRSEHRTGQYDADRYDTALMKHLYPRYREAFARKRGAYQPLLPPGAEILEVGSHTGAFLEIGENWGWRPIGLDIGGDTSAFARRMGGTVKQLSLHDYDPGTRPQAIFIWNCFEQLDDPLETLRRAHQLLSRHGLLVLRVPNIDYYRHAERNASQWLRALSYNNLLAFPYRNGYNLPGLQRLLASSGFEDTAAFGTSLLTPPYPDWNRQIRKEWQQTRLRTERLGAASSPWIEIVGRAVDSPLAFRRLPSELQ